MVTKFRRVKKRGSRSPSRQGVFSTIVIISVLILIISFLFLTNIKIKERRDKLLSEIQNLEREIKGIEENNKKLQENIQKAETKEYLEKIAREQLGLKSPGEEVVVISREQTEGQEQKQSENKNKWDPRVWWDWFKGKLRD